MAGELLVAGDVPADVREAVTGVVAALEQAFNTKDAVALGSLFGERASWTDALGRRLDGRTAVIESSAPALQGFLRNSFARYEVTKLLAIADDVIAVNVTQTPTDADGRPVEGPHGAALYVVARQAAGWKIVAGQNNAVDAQSAA
ncbi:SgcJ/EcaC family oxidoreductase [Kitasatospora sp. NPDC093806]|uniref:SgcJ/EcaC family oxidoreductase n=1 Tax=Kitasatospora sp. NPDC093806 TaxID=3155075 RepID=UPI00341E1C95